MKEDHVVLLGRTSPDGFGRSMPSELTSTTAWADRMITLLKKRETERAASCANLSEVAK